MLDISTRFITVDAEHVPAQIERSLEQLRQFLQVDGGYLYRGSLVDGSISMAHTVGDTAREMRRGLPRAGSLEGLGPWLEAFRQRRPMVVEDVSAPTAEAEFVRQMTEPLGLRSTVDGLVLAAMITTKGAFMLPMDILSINDSILFENNAITAKPDK